MRGGQEAGEERLLNEAQTGNADAFGELYTCYAPDVFRFLFARLSNREDAEDLTEEVFLRAWRNLPEYRYQGVSFLAFLLKIAHNLLVDRFRKGVQQESELPDDERGGADCPLVEGPELLPHLDLQDLLGQLPDDYRAVLAARFINGMTPDETAVVMHRSAGAVRVLQHRALGALRKLVKNS
jgi:RNA polymerase sigma-70 factor (ECF subfamily)